MVEQKEDGSVVASDGCEAEQKVVYLVPFGVALSAAALD